MSVSTCFWNDSIVCYCIVLTSVYVYMLWKWLYSLLFYRSDFYMCLHALEMVLQFAILLFWFLSVTTCFRNESIVCYCIVLISVCIYLLWKWVYSLLLYCSDFWLCLHALEMVLQFAFLLFWFLSVYTCFGNDSQVCYFIVLISVCVYMLWKWFYNLLFYGSEFCLCLHA